MAAEPHESACTVHISQEFLALHVEAQAHIQVVYVPPNTKAVCRSTEPTCGHSRPRWADLRHATLAGKSTTIPTTLPTSPTALLACAGFIMTWTHDALQETATMPHDIATWSDIVCSPTEEPEVLALATSPARSSSHTAATLARAQHGCRYGTSGG